MIRYEAVSKSYGAVSALSGLDLEVREGELLVMLGASGSGKTTALKVVNRLLEPSAGRVLVGGRPVTETEVTGLRRGIGYAFQNVGLFPHLTVEENAGMGPRLAGWDARAMSERVDEVLRLVGLSPAEYRTRMPRMLSGGQQQRVGLARALALRPRILLLDEPFAALDPTSRDALQKKLADLHRALGLTTVLVTHDVGEALRLGDRLAFLDGGRIVRVGAREDIVQEPGHPSVEALLAPPLEQMKRLASMLEVAP